MSRITREKLDEFINDMLKESRLVLPLLAFVELALALKFLFNANLIMH